MAVKMKNVTEECKRCLGSGPFDPSSEEAFGDTVKYVKLINKCTQC